MRWLVDFDGQYGSSIRGSVGEVSPGNKDTFFGFTGKAEIIHVTSKMKYLD